ncbi:hypothetical protein DPMN_064032 [Dreissena polymorpha]|uniref:Uncharacterized protein n=1 Tax=Dreissena polymorpha TaxID=45954 RepID=A0A9D4HJ47_DREPO|nr:hypothetical protein DPMN_064032 [Dreissena polymorpha]
MVTRTRLTHHHPVKVQIDLKPHTAGLGEGIRSMTLVRRKFSEATGGSGKPEKSTRDSQSNIEMVESCKTLRRDAESETGAILKASSRSVRLSGVPRTPSKFLVDTPKDPTVSLSRTNNGPYASSGDTS